MRIYISVLVFCLSLSMSKAQVLSFDHGKVEFHTSSIMSDIEAVSNDIDVSFDLTSGAVDIRIPIASFEFEYEMMRDHFNEDYLESDTYPDATFTGKITSNNINIETASEVEVIGDLTIHGVTKKISFDAMLSKKDSFTKVKCVFPIVFKDFNIDEPSILSKSVAKDVELKAIIYLK